MIDGELLALTQLWWCWDTPRIRRALAASLLEHWLPQAKSALKRNAQRRLQPATWWALKELRRNPRNVRRVIEGNSATTAGFLLGIATILRLNVRRLYPELLAWVSRAARHLCGRQMAASDCAVYAEFVIARPPCGRSWFPTETECRLRALSPEIREKVLRVAQQLGPVLQQSDRSLRQRTAAPSAPGTRRRILR